MTILSTRVPPHLRLVSHHTFNCHPPDYLTQISPDPSFSPHQTNHKMASTPIVTLPISGTMAMTTYTFLIEIDPPAPTTINVLIPNSEGHILFFQRAPFSHQLAPIGSSETPRCRCEVGQWGHHRRYCMAYPDRSRTELPAAPHTGAGILRAGTSEWKVRVGDQFTSIVLEGAAPVGTDRIFRSN